MPRCKCGHIPEAHFTRLLECEEPVQESGGATLSVKVQKIGRAWCSRCSCKRYEEEKSCDSSKS